MLKKQSVSQPVSVCTDSKDVLAMGELIAKFSHLHDVCSNLLPEDAQREFTGTGDAGGSTGGVKSEMSDAERTAETKRKGREQFEATKRGQRKKLNDERTKSMQASTNTSIDQVIQYLRLSWRLLRLQVLPGVSAQIRRKTKPSRWM